jgi:ABC-2 type transport system permease protein
MRSILRIALREYVASVCTKGFILGLVLAPVLMSGGLIGGAITVRQSKSTDRQLLVIDHSGGQLGKAIQEAAEQRNRPASPDAKPGASYRIEIAPSDHPDPDARRLELSDRVRRGSLHAYAEIGSAVLKPGPDATNGVVRYHAKNPVLDEVRQWLGGVVNTHVRRTRLQEAGLDLAAVDRLVANVPIEGMGLATRDTASGAVRSAQKQNEALALGVPLLIGMFGMMLMLMGSAPLLQSVMEEKTQRIAEVLLSAATPWEIMAGKLLGGLGTSLTAGAVYLGGGWITLISLAQGSMVPWTLVPWLTAYIVAATLMYGAVAAALGAACSDAKDAQQMQLPVMLPVIVPMFLLLPVIKDPQSTLATSLSLFPPFTPLLMLIRMGAPGGVPAWQPWVGLVGVLLTAAAALWMGSRIFRIGILFQGKLPGLAELLRWGIRG